MTTTHDGYRAAWRTTYGDGWGREYHAIKLSWDQVHEILGCDHEGNGEDDARLIQALREMGAPEWIDEAEGWTDEHGWGLIGPEIEAEAIAAHPEVREQLEKTREERDE